MLNINTRHSRTDRKRFFKTIFLYFLIPIAIISLSAVGVYKSYKTQLQTEVEYSYVSSLNTLADTIDNMFTELQRTTLLLSSDQSLYDIFYSDQKISTDESYKINNMVNTLSKFRTTKALIDSVYVVHKGSNKVLDTSGTYNLNDFFTRPFNYGKYDSNFWLNLKVPNNFFTVLEPSVVWDKTLDTPTSRKVIPFVTSNVNNYKSRNLFVINLSNQSIADILGKYKFIPNSNISIINSRGTIFASSNDNISEDVTASKDFLSKASNSTDNFFEYKIDGKKYLVITTSSNTNRFNDFIYTVFVPYNDFYKKSESIKTLTYFIIFLGLFLSTVLAYFMSKRIYSPINNLVETLSKNSSDSTFTGKSEIEYLSNQINKILTNEDALKKGLSIAMPLASERYLVKILTDSDTLAEEDVQNFIYNNHINFKHNAFCVGLVDLGFTDKYYNSFNKEELDSVRKAISKMLNDMALGDYPTYVIKMNRNLLCVLINLPESDNLDGITENIRNVLSLFNNDKDLLTLKSGIGRIYPEFVGMNKSYNEALRALASLSPLSSDKVKVFSEGSTSISYHYSINDENKLYNYLVGGYKDEALTFLNLLIEKNYHSCPSEESIKKFYLEVYNTALRATNEKKQTVEKLMDSAYINLPNDIALLSNDKINSYIFDLINKILSISKPSGKIDLVQITNFIKEHFTEDLYLEKLAEEFNVSDKYLSRLFKDSLGTGFHEYLASLRVSKAKELLLETNHPVTRIGEMVGFTTHSTFFRIFKKFEGINPTQYRENLKNN
jgi:two-component system, response regulator YesN